MRVGHATADGDPALPDVNAIPKTSEGTPTLRESDARKCIPPVRHLAPHTAWQATADPIVDRRLR